jgi:hypothetical protein
MTNNWVFPAWLVQVLGLAGALLTFLGADAEFMKMLPGGVATTLHAVIPFLTYLGVTQIKASESH